MPFRLHPARAAEEAPEVTAWLVICPDNSVVIRVARSEMGQGAQTGLAMLVAEELECDWAKVRTEFVAPEENLAPRPRLGRSVDRRQPFDRVLAALPAAGRRHRPGDADRRGRGALECAGVGMRRAHERDHAPADRPHADIRRRRRGRGKAHAARLTVKLKEPGTWKLAGKPRRRLDVLDKVTAQPVYAIDVRLPGMLYAAIAALPGIRRQS